MGSLCNENRDKRKEIPINKIKQLKLEINKGIIRNESEMQMLGDEIKKMKINLNLQTPNVKNEQIEDLKRDILNKIKSYKQCKIQNRVLKNNLEIIEKKEREGRFAEIINEANSVFDVPDNYNSEVFNQNNIKIGQQQDILQKNDNILQDGDKMFFGNDKYKIDDLIANFNP